MFIKTNNIYSLNIAQKVKPINKMWKDYCIFASKSVSHFMPICYFHKGLTWESVTLDWGKKDIF